MSSIYELVVGGVNGAGNFFQNVFHYVLSEAGIANPFTYAQALINEWQSSVLPDFLDCLASDVLINLLKAKKVNNGGGLSSVGVANAPGTGPNLSISNGLAADVAWISDSPINRAGHTYVGPIWEGSLEKDTWDPSIVAVLTTWGNSQIATMTLAAGLGTADFVLFHRKLGTDHVIKNFDIRAKATLLNRRLLPIT